MAVKKLSEDHGLHLRVLYLFYFLRIAGSFCLRLAVAFGIDVGLEENVFAIGRPELAVGFGGDGSKLVNSEDSAASLIEIGNPDLRAAVFGGNKGKALAVGRPAGAISVLIGDEDSFWRSRRASLDLGGRDVRPYMV